MRKHKNLPTLEALKSIEASEPGRCQVVKRLKISVPQLYRLLDCANAHKHMKQLLALLLILNCDVALVVENNVVESNLVKSNMVKSNEVTRSTV